MNLKEMMRDKIVKDVLRPSSEDEWHVFVYNASTARILTYIFTKTQILSNEILSMQRLELKRDPIPYPAIYFVTHCKDTYKAIKKDVKNKIYTKYYVVHTNRIDENDKIIGENIFYKYVDINFVVIDERIFTGLNGVGDAIRSFSSILKLRFNVINLKADTALYEQLKTCSNTSESRNEYYNSDLIVLDRSFDMIVPLIHFFNFESLIHDLNLCKDNTDESPLYREIRYMHIADTNSVLNNKAQKLVEGMKKIDKKTDINEIHKLVLEAPENIKLKESVNRYINLAEDTLNLFEKEQLNYIATFEQNISTGYDSKGNRYHGGLRDVFGIFNQKIKRENKLRLVLLLLSTHYDFQTNEVTKLKDKLMLTDQEIKIFEKLKTMRKNFNKRKEYNSKFTYEISRYDPLLHDLLRAFVQNKNNRFSNLVKRETTEKKESLRKSSFVFMKHEAKKKALVLYIDVLTYPEMMLINQMSEKSSYEIFVCTNQVVTPKEYLKWLEEIKV